MDINAEVLIVGGGPTGLTAALTLAPLSHTVKVFDNDKPRNHESSGMTMLIAHDGDSPERFRDAAIRNLISVLPAIQANLSDADNASSAALFSFMWGTAVPAIIFNNETDRSLHLISDPTVAAAFSRGKAYSLVSSGLVSTLSPSLKEEVAHMLNNSLKPVWYGALVFSLLGFALTFGEKHVEMRTELNTEYGIETERKAADHGVKDT